MSAFWQAFQQQIRRRGEAGQAVIVLALGFIALAGFIGITTDISLMFVRYAQLSRAVDSASIAAANQMRQDRSLASVGLAARQFIEFHGLNPETVWVDTCQTMPGDPELCTQDQAKLVRVRAFIKEPTAFMRLLGIDHFDLVASAVSQTAALDVVLVMDVSETMLAQTTYEDWAKTEIVDATPALELDSTPRQIINLGAIYRAPRFTEIYQRILATDPQANAYSNYTDYDIGTFDDRELWLGYRAGRVAGGAQIGLLNVAQSRVNNRLTYWNINNTTQQLETPPITNVNVPDAVSPYGSPSGEFIYKVWTNLNFFENTTRFPTWPAGAPRTATQPREECRIRFYPPAESQDSLGIYSGYRDAATGARVPLATTYAQAGFTWPSPTNNQVLFDGFIPAYTFYDCCNDPRGDGTFEDLNCQPFKSARDAAFQFLDRIDFVRGDRAALVTYDRGAFLLNPYGESGGTRQGAMMDNHVDAFATMRNLMGVRAEPNFYNYVVGTGPGFTSGWGTFRTDPDGAGPQTANRFSVGLKSDGTSFIVDYESGTMINTSFTASVPPVSVALEPHLYNYPVQNNCPFALAGYGNNAMTLFFGSLANIALPNGMNNALTAPPGGDFDLDHGRNPAWEGYVSTAPTNSGGTYPATLIEAPQRGRLPSSTDIYARSSYNANMSYERWASCRGANIGAALREANNALLNPRTTRRFGTIWIVVLLSAGAAGSSDPVRRNGYMPAAASPYEESINFPGTWGRPGDYGAFGLCPMGVPGSVDTTGELVEVANDVVASGAVDFPYCSDEDPRTRQTCDFRPLRTLEAYPNTAQQKKDALKDRRYVAYDASKVGPAFVGSYPQTPEEELDWNRTRGFLYDVDIANQNVEPNYGQCNPLYDTDDYARDWADFISINNLVTTTGNAQLPTIFTIGFGVRYEKLTTATGSPLVADTSKPVNHQDNQPLAQSNWTALCERNINKCLGETLLRYIADVGDNNILDNDYYQDLMQEWYNFDLVPGANLDLTGYMRDGERFGPRDACQAGDSPPTGIYRELDGDGGTFTQIEQDAQWQPLGPNLSCGNYYFAPGATELQFIFDDIASRMFTRLSR